MRLHSICGYGHCRETACTHCMHAKFYLTIGKWEIKLPQFINDFIVKKGRGV